MRRRQPISRRTDTPFPYTTLFRSLRGAPPQPAKPWSGERIAVMPGPSCPQPMRPDNAPNSGGANGPTSENCLQLNVFAPKAAKTEPMMVSIPGGGNRTGAGWDIDAKQLSRAGVEEIGKENAYTTV